MYATVVVVVWIMAKTLLNILSNVALQTFCGNEVDGTLCNDGAKDVVKASDDECAGMIAGMMDPDQDTYSVKCPNNRAISHYVIYDCHGTSGTKYEPGNESTCSGRRNLRADKTSSRFW